ncbi:retinal homeobox protein Rx-like [Condylostylus longicornis]|uniref:retinal homeobox protein Rx-like n=1 Tax=Condylostylus longicornis TaxID=2530218 RepID=UPI00244DE7A2|nr:retinal homeobox protein Rx-like [Condylostylus longicornis]
MRNDESFLLCEVWFQNRRAKWRRQEKSESLRLGLSHFSQLPHRLSCNGSISVDPWLSPPLLSALPGFLTHPQTVYPSYLTPPISLAPNNLGIKHPASNGQQNLRVPSNVAMSVHSANMHIAPSSITSHITDLSCQNNSPAAQNTVLHGIEICSVQHLQQQSSIDLSCKANISTQNNNLHASSPQLISDSTSQFLPATIENITQSTAQISTIGLKRCHEELSEGNSVPSKNDNVKDFNTTNSDIRSNSIAVLRIKAKEHLENMSKGLAT